MEFFFSELFGKAFIPEKIRPNLQKYLLKAGYVEIPYGMFGNFFYLTLLITGGIYLTWLQPYLQRVSPAQVALYSFLGWVIIQLSLAVLIMFSLYFYFDMRIYQRTKAMESVLPDFLQVVSINLRGGLSFENSLWQAIQPQFSTLSVEIDRVAKKVMTGADVAEALQEFADSYDSPTLKRAIALIISEVGSGGRVADLLDDVVEDMREVKALKDEMVASVVSYIMFVAIIVVFIAPFLFAVSHLLLSIIAKIGAKVAASTRSSVVSVPLSFSKVSLNPDEFRTFAMVALGTISLFSSMIVSIIEKGDIRGGVKYIPIFVIGSLSLFLIVSHLIAGFMPKI